MVAVPQLVAPPGVGEVGSRQASRRAVAEMDLPAIELRLGGVDVAARLSHAPMLGYRTFFEAGFALGVGPRFRAGPDEIERGDASLIEAAVGAAAQTWASDSFRHAKLDSNGEVVSLMMTGFITDERLLRDGLHIVGAIGASDAFAIQSLRELTGAAFIDRDEQTEMPAVEVTVPERVRLGPALRGPSAVTVVRTTAGRSVGFEVELGIGGELPECLPDELPRGVLMDLAKLGPGALSARSGEIQFEWTRIESNTELLTGAARALGALARALGAGIYR